MQTGTAGGRVVLVTGAAGGLGSAMTAALLAAGHSVAAADRDAAALAELVVRHRQTAAERLFPLPADLADRAQCAAAVDAAVAHFGRLEGLINNAGIGMSSLRPDAEVRHPGMDELTPQVWDRFVAVNMTAPMLLARAALASMRQQGWGRIVNNTTSYRTMLRVQPYGATKAALESMSAVWAAELAGSGITVNVLVPGGPTDTPFISDGAGWPRDRMLRPEIMGPPIRWLLSEEASDFTGRRVTAARWDAALSGAEAARRASREIGWPELAADAVWLQAQPA